MTKSKLMQILLIEDDELEVHEFEQYIEAREDVKIIKSTKSSYEGIECVKKYIPDGIILDLELHEGEGSGLKFLEELENIKLDFKPLIVVTTNVASEITYEHIHRLGVDFIFYKKQAGYNPDIVVNSIVSLRNTVYRDKANRKQILEETPLEREEKIKEKIENELDMIGISNHLKGRKYLFEAIFYLLDKNDKAVFCYLSNKYKIGSGSISRAMQTAINYAWRISSVDDLMLHYKARINYETGVPTPTEFIYYYAEKIRKFL